MRQSDFRYPNARSSFSRPDVTEPASHVAKRELALSVAMAFAGLIAPSAAAATVYTQPITGVASNDTTGGSGGYNPGYTVTSDGTTATYTLLAGDSINVESAATNVYGVDITTASNSTVIDATAGDVSITATRDVPSSGTDSGSAVGVYVSSPQNDPRTVTINGDITVNAIDHNSWTQRIGGTIYGNAYALWADNYGIITINGNATLNASTPGYGRVIYLTGNGSQVNINGNLTAESDSNSTDYAIEQDGRGVLNVSGNVNLTADGVYPSDNVNGIWNESVSAHTWIGGNLDLYAIAHGSTVMGIRNNGYIYVTGSSTITAIGNRSAFGVNAGHRLSKTEFHGDATISAQGGTSTFGDTTGVYNYGGNGGNGYMTFDGNVTITATDGTFEGDSDVYGLSNAGRLTLSTAGTLTTIEAIGTQGTHSAYGIDNSLSLTAASNVAITTSEVAGATYGIVNTGTASFTGSLSIAQASTSTATDNYGIVTTSGGSSTATTNINQGESNNVTIRGDVLTGSSGGYSGVLNLNLDTSKSWLEGLVLGDTDGSIGQANVAFSNGASWIVTGTGTLGTDFGTGSLTIGSGGNIDMAASWGTFSVGSVPSYSLRTLQIGSSTSGASVSLADGATFTLLSNIRSGQADEVVFGSGVTSFTASGTQDIRIAYDPVLDSTSWVNASALRNGVTIAASKSIVIVDASAAASGAASFLAVKGLTSQWSASYENALVSFSYVPVVSLSSDRKQILLTGIDILGNGTTSTGSSSTGTTTTGNTGTTTTTTGSGTSSNSGSTGSAASTTSSSGGITTSQTLSITPSTGVLVAGDAALALSNLWQIEEQAVSRRSESLRLDDASSASGLWVDTDGGDFEGSSTDGRSYRQSLTNASIGAERQIDVDGGRDAIGLVYTHTQSNASLQNGRAALNGDSLGAYGSWIPYQGMFIDVVARAGQLRNSYSSMDAYGSASGRYRSRAASLSMRTGRRFQNSRGGYIEPQVQAAYGSIGRNSYTASDNVHYNVNQNRTFLSRAGVMAGKTFSLSPTITGDFYTRVAMVHTIGSRPDITASLDGGSIPVTLPTRHATTAEAAVGGHVALARRWSAFAEAGRTSRSNALASGWRASAGLRLSF